MELTINRKTYRIGKGDLFLERGDTVELLTQSQEKPVGGRRPNPVLSKRAVKELRDAGVIETPSKLYGGTTLVLE